jgi:hypothetical protein
MKIFHVPLILLLIALCPSSLFGQDCKSYVSSQSLSTGIDPTTGSLLPLGALDPVWTVISDPSPSTVEPRPANILATPSSAWGVFSGSNWIGAQSATENDYGDYEFERCFCLRDGFSNPILHLTLRADNRADVFLNGSTTPILQGTQDDFWSNVPPDALANPLTTGFKFGPNCLVVRVRNDSGPTGFDLTGSITASGPGGTPGVAAPACCKPTGAICGMKWNDLNHDGVHQSTEPGLPNWTIQLGNGQTAVTDPFGNYCFNNLQPGTYNVTEQGQSGWQQTTPAAPPSYTVALGAATAVGGRDFGNWKIVEEGRLKICKVAGFGVAVGTPFHFTIGSNSLNVPAGPAPGGYCAIGPSFPIGTTVMVAETIPVTNFVSSVTVDPLGQLVGTANLAAGTANVQIGSGITEVTYTNRMKIHQKTGFLEICKQNKGKGNFTFTVNPGNLGPFVVPARACSPAIEVLAGTVTITETPTSGTVLAGCSTIPSNRQVGCNPSTLTSTVTVVPGNVSTQTVAIFTNRPRIHPLDPTAENPN